MVSNQELNSKDAGMFKQLRKFHDQKQYKKALKTADQILKIHPEHGETLAMKGLTLNYLNKKDEAYANAKLGLQRNIKSPICWHAYGLIYRSDRNYLEAIKCYMNALKMQGGNVQILRDLAILQIQVRDIAGYQKTRKELVVQQSNQRSNWIGFSMAHHLGCNYDLALEILNLHISTLAETRPRPSYEESEILLYKALLLEESGKLVDSLNLLKESKDDIMDIVTRRERIASLSLQLGYFEEAESLYQELLESNPESYDYHRGLQGCLLGISDLSSYSGCQLPVQNLVLSGDQMEMIKKTYEKLAVNFPKAFAVKRIPLDFLSGDDFKESVQTFLLMALRKGIPALFSSVKPLYKIAMREKADLLGGTKLSAELSSKITQNNLERVKIIRELIEQYLDAVKSNLPLPQSKDDGKEAPTVLLWLYYFYAQHLDICGELDSALEIIETAIVHTPTLVDLYFVKGRILKHAGNLDGAVDALESGRKLDLADKWINSKSCKYFLRANRIKEGDDVISLFTKHEGDSRLYLMDMQCMWYEIEAANAFFRTGNIAMALKLFKSVVKHFDDIYDDQLDFHMYCLRKVTLNAYLSTLRLEDTIRNHPYFLQAASGIVKCLLKIHDQTKDFVDDENAEPDYASMTASERKKAKAKARKAQAKKDAEAVQALSANESNTDKKRKDLPVDNDPNGKTMFETESKTPLVGANDIVQVVGKVSHGIGYCIDMFEIQIRRQMYLQAFRALYHAANSFGVNHVEVFPRLIPFLHIVLETGTCTYAPWCNKSTNASDMNTPVSEAIQVSEPVKAVIRTMSSSFLEGKSTENIIKEYQTMHLSGGSLTCRAAACQASIIFDPSSRSQCFASICSDCPVTASFADIQDFLVFLKYFGCPSADIDKFSNSVKTKFPTNTL